MDMNAILSRIIFPTSTTSTATAAAAESAAAAVARNDTAAAGHGDGGGMPTVHHLIETLLPLLGLRSFVPLYGLVGGSLGVDPTNLLMVLGLLWALNRLSRQVYHVLYGLVMEHLMSTVHVSSTDDIYVHMMKWLAAQPRMVNSRSLTAETVSRTAWEDEDESNVARDRSGQYLNFSNQEARSVGSRILRLVAFSSRHTF